MSSCNFLDLKKLFKEARNVLHNNETVIYLLNTILSELSEKECTVYQWYEFYSNLALEAFQHQAESGFITSIEWVLKLTQAEHLRERVREWPLINVILLHISLSLYNFAKDAKYRYGLTDETLLRFYKQYDQYNNLVKYFCDDREFVGEDGKHLLYFMDAILTEIVINNYFKDKQHFYLSARDKVKNFIDIYHHGDEYIPKLLIGLYLRHAAKILTQDQTDAMEFFRKALKQLEEFSNGVSYLTSFYYDAVYGKFASSLLFLLGILRWGKRLILNYSIDWNAMVHRCKIRAAREWKPLQIFFSSLGILDTPKIV